MGREVPAKEAEAEVERLGTRCLLPGWVPQWFRFLCCITYFGLLCALAIPLSVFLLPRRRRRSRIVKIFTLFLWPFISAFYGIRIEVTGKENRGSLGKFKPVVYVANHSSTLDFLTCSRCLSAGTIAIAKKALILHPLGWVAWIGGTVFIDRRNRQKAIDSMNSVAGTLREYGVSVCVFPEGTRSRDGRLQPFKKGAMHLALQAKCPIVPVVINGAHHIWGKTGYMIKVNADPIKMKFLPPIDTSEWTAASLDKHTEELRELFIQNLSPESQPLKEE